MKEQRFDSGPAPGSSQHTLPTGCAQAGLTQLLVPGSQVCDIGWGALDHVCALGYFGNPLKFMKTFLIFKCMR